MGDPQTFAAVRWDVLDGDNQTVGTVVPADSGTFSSKEGVRQVRGMRLFPGSGFDPYASRLRPTWVEGGVDTPLGIFVAVAGNDEWVRYQNPSGPTVGYVETWDLQDLTARLDVPLLASVGLAQGATVSDLIVELLEAAGIVDHEVTFFPVGVVEPATWEQGRDTTLGAVADLVDTVGGRFFFDADGVAIAEATPAPGDLSVDRVYDTDGTILEAPVYGRDPFAANRWERVGGTDVAPIVGTYDLPADAANSYANRGFVVLDRRDTVATDSATATAAAQAAAVDAVGSADTVDFSTVVEPATGAWECVSVDGVLYVESSWAYDLRGDSQQTHTAGRVFVP